MFKNCIFLTEIKIENNKEDISKKNSKMEIKISAINEIFSNCLLLKAIPVMPNWDTGNVIDMSKIFYNCKTLSVIPDISQWNTSNVIDMNRMFYNCVSLKSLPDLSKWKRDKVVNVIKIFYNCLFLSSISDIFKKKSKNININSLPEKSYSIFKLI